MENLCDDCVSREVCEHAVRSTTTRPRPGMIVRKYVTECKHRFNRDEEFQKMKEKWKAARDEKWDAISNLGAAEKRADDLATKLRVIKRQVEG
jgi:hypothetical protein